MTSLLLAILTVFSDPLVFPFQSRSGPGPLPANILRVRAAKSEQRPGRDGKSGGPGNEHPSSDSKASNMKPYEAPSEVLGGIHDPSDMCVCGRVWRCTQDIGTFRVSESQSFTFTVSSHSLVILHQTNGY